MNGKRASERLLEKRLFEWGKFDLTSPDLSEIRHRMKDEERRKRNFIIMLCLIFGGIGVFYTGWSNLLKKEQILMHMPELSWNSMLRENGEHSTEYTPFWKMDLIKIHKDSAP